MKNLEGGVRGWWKGEVRGEVCALGVDHGALERPKCLPLQPFPPSLPQGALPCGAHRGVEGALKTHCSELRNGFSLLLLLFQSHPGDLVIGGRRGTVKWCSGSWLVCRVERVSKRRGSLGKRFMLDQGQVLEGDLASCYLSD